MQPRNRYTTVYLVLAGILFLGIMFLQGYIWPPPKPPQKATGPEVFGFYAGAMATVCLDKEVDVFLHIEEERKQTFPSALGDLGSGLVTVAVGIDAPALAALERQNAAAKPAEPDELIAMGRGEKPFHLQVLLNTRGGSIQQVILTHFQEADREGLAVVNPDGTPRPLHLIPGYVVERAYKMRDQHDLKYKPPELVPGKVDIDPAKFAHPSYVMWHYEKEADDRPVDTLGTRHWRVVPATEPATEDKEVVAFETELGAPFYLKITKTYTLSRTDYHVGLAVALTPTERPLGAKVESFRYQIDGARNLPIEGEWYTTTYRQGVVGWENSRTLEDARTIRYQGGSDRLVGKAGHPIKYAGVMVQYFASVLAVDNVQPSPEAGDFLEYVRLTPEGPPNEKGKLDQTFLDDLTARAISKKLEISAPLTHSYVLYQGPVKVRLLKQLEGAAAVPEATVNRYRDDLNLRTLTDAPSPTWLGRFANAIFWSDIVIAFTNLIHSLLGLMTQVIPNVGICILLITVIVRGLLHPFARRTMINGKITQARQAKLAPEVKKLTEKYGNDFNKLNQEKMKLYREHGINPAAAMGGCLLLLFQMPAFMGLYFALQESVFFRLEPATPWWIHNLAAPDMLIRWGENIPWISVPEDLGTTLYLGPYFNLLPLIAVALMMYTQSKMMPKSDDPQVAMQQKTMKIMMIFMLFFFYKSPAGLAIYFIAGSVWGMIERKLLPKNIEELAEKQAADAKRRKESGNDEPAKPKGWMGKKMAGWREKWDQILEEAQKQQQHQTDKRATNNDGQGPGKKKKKNR
ncbi:MAG TPA: membrane protein insertase YidC [Gemmataceae bacterium]|jgi:YidC/Oxa1 family membrane protein insertase|nr:membrane protein insertase YidC [Gemmataceae bacterium]